MTEDFERYMEFYKTQPLKEKQEIIIDQLQMLSSFTNSLCNELSIPNDVFIHKELVDVKKGEYTADDFAEAIIVYINSIQNSICDYSSGVSDLLDKIEEELQ